MYDYVKQKYGGKTKLRCMDADSFIPAGTWRSGRPSFEGCLKVLTSGAYMGPSRDSQGTNTKIDDIIKNIFLDAIVLVLHIYFCFFLQKEQIFKSFKWTSLRPSCGKSRGPNNGTFCGRPRGVSDICFLDSTHKHIKLTLIGYSRFYSEWQ